MPALQISLRSSRETAQAPLRTFESATAEVIAMPERVPQRATIYVLAAFIVAVLAFISFIKIDRLVKASGRLMPIAGTLTVQPLEKAIINRVLVSVGDVVKKGQVLATCDPTFAQADLTQLQQKIASLQAQLRRMRAESVGEALPEPGADANSYDLLQASIWRQRQTEFHSGVSDFDQRINSTAAQVAGLRQSIPDLEARLKIVRQVEAMNANLAPSGYVSQLELLNARDQRVQLESTLSTSQSTLDSTEHQLESLRQQRQQFIDKWREDNLTSLAAANDELDAAQQDLEKSQKVSELVNLVAPEDAIVVKVPNLSSGAIATEALPLFSLVPVGAPLEADIQIESLDIGFVKVGDPVIIKFDAYKFLEHGTGTGVVKTISEDSFTEAPTQDSVTSVAGGGGGSNSRSPFFDARIKITAINLHDVPKNFRISPGMTIQSDIIVGRRTIMWYLLGGALRSGSEAMHEP
jgi:membrane fusion protein, hemolysin D